jgi:hypothetical protein
LKFLNDFYINHPAWKEFGPGANDMMINSDNVYLLKPLNIDNDPDEQSIKVHLANTGGSVVVINFYTCNGTLDKVIELFRAQWLPFLKSLEIRDITCWVSEMSENKFPRLPAFQDKNLLLTITHFSNENEYKAKRRQIEAIPFAIKNAMQESITIQSNLVLSPANTQLHL